MTTRDERELKTRLFGSVGRIKATGGYTVPVEHLHDPLEWEHGVVRHFCEGCGAVFELKESRALRFVEMAGVEKPKSWEGWYFHGRACEVCDGLEPLVELRAIPEVLDRKQALPDVGIGTE